MPWWRKKSKSEPDNALISVGDPALAAWFGVAPNDAGVPVNERSALGVSSVWRACALISGTIASLPLKTYRDINPGERQRIQSFLDDNPGGPFWSGTAYDWKQTIILHLLLHGRALLLHVYNQAGSLIGLQPIHPFLAVTNLPTYDNDGRLLPKTFTVTRDNGTTVQLTEGVNVTEVLGMSLDGWYGLSVIATARNSLGATIAGDRAAARMFSTGALMSGMVTPEEDVSPAEARKIKRDLDAKTSGWENAGQLAFVNRKLKFSNWTMSAEDAQFIQTRQFQIEEVARWFGIPPFELMQTEKQTSWGTGIEAQQRGLARGNLLGWTMRLEQNLSRLLARPRFAEFDFSALERPTPEQEIRLLIEQVQGGLITVNEARQVRNLPPVAGGNALRGTTPEPTPGPSPEQARNTLEVSAP